MKNLKTFLPPILCLGAAVALASLTSFIMPYFIGTDTINEQVNGTLPVGSIYTNTLEALNLIFSFTIWFCVGWFGVKIFKFIGEKTNK